MQEQVSGGLGLKERTETDSVVVNAGSISRPARLEIPREHGLSAKAFHERYVAGLQPVILAGKMADWPALSLWTPEYFATTFADVEQRASVNLPDTAVPSLHPWREHAQSMTMAEFYDWMGTSDLPCYLDSSGLHLYKGEEKHVDYSDMVWDDEGRRITLLWIGSANTHSGLHFDRYNNLFGQVYGSKKVCLLAPDQARYLYQFRDVIQKSHLDAELPDWEHYPKFAEATVYEATIRPGEILFIPKLWWHSLRSLETSISVNHWFGKDAGIQEMLPLWKAAGPMSWLTTLRDFVWYGLLGRPFEQRLLCEVPNGYWMYEQARDAFTTRLRSH